VICGFIMYFTNRKKEGKEAKTVTRAGLGIVVAGVLMLIQAYLDTGSF